MIVWGCPTMMWGHGGRGGSSYGSRNLMIDTGRVLSLVRTQRCTHWAPHFPLFIQSQTPEHEMMTRAWSSLLRQTSLEAPWWTSPELGLLGDCKTREDSNEDEPSKVNHSIESDQTLTWLKWWPLTNIEHVLWTISSSFGLDGSRCDKCAVT